MGDNLVTLTETDARLVLDALRYSRPTVDYPEPKERHERARKAIHAALDEAFEKRQPPVR